MNDTAQTQDARQALLDDLNLDVSDEDLRQAHEKYVN